MNRRSADGSNPFFADHNGESNLVVGSPSGIAAYNVMMETTDRIVRFKEFRGTFKSWSELFGEASAFATTLGSQRLISISHSEDNNRGVVAVWYWEDSERSEN
jgi:hypothetical protein